MDKGTCSVDGCELPFSARDLCEKHYKIWWRQNRVTQPCSIEGCDAPAQSRGWCVKHYKRWRNHGDPQHEREAPSCSVDGCDRPAAGWGWCKAHWSRWKRTGDVEAGRPLKSPARVNNGPCSVEGCGKQAEKRGWCGNHWRRWRQYGDPESSVYSWAAQGGVCLACGSPDLMPGSRRYCSVRCQSSVKAAATPEPPLPVFTCTDCGDTFQRKSRRSVPPKRCEDCRATYTRKYKAKWADAPERRATANAKALAYHKAHPEVNQASKGRRRAREWSAPTETFRHREIFERDGWICGICTEAVDPALRYPDPFSRSLDHIIPLSKGGHHTRANCQLAHLRCNLRKQASLTFSGVGA